MSKIVIVTSNHPRHHYLVREIQKRFEITGLAIERKPENYPMSSQGTGSIVRDYFSEREKAEKKYFGSDNMFDMPEDIIKQLAWGEISSEGAYSWIKERLPDFIVLFGSSIVKDPLLSEYEGRIINMHLGLSPYYRGSSTNFWPLVDSLPECVGVTIHHAVLKVDGGNILAQGRPHVTEDDFSHDFGCKSIIKGVQLLVQTLDILKDTKIQGIAQGGEGKLCRRKDFTVEALIRMQNNFTNGMVREYLNRKEERDLQFPIIEMKSVDTRT